MNHGIRRSKTHILSFADHAGKEALMVFDGTETCPLPSLYSFSFYFTHEAVNSGNVHPTEFLRAIIQDTPFVSYPCPFRLEIYFLPMPGATAEKCDEACIAHYEEEKKGRGIYHRQIMALKASIRSGRSSSTDRGRLPGFVSSYVEDRFYDYHRGLLYSYQGADWRTDEQLVRRIKSNAIPHAENSLLADEIKEDEFTPIRVTLQAIKKSDTAGHVGEWMFYSAHGPTECITNGPWGEAEERGWTTWQE
jgi:hypothetical protein